MTVRQLMESLRGGRFTSVGSYPKYWVAADGGVLSYEAIVENIWQVARATRDKFDLQWAILGCEVNWEDRRLYCDHTGERIPSAYAEEPEAEDNDECASGHPGCKNGCLPGEAS